MAGLPIRARLRLRISPDRTRASRGAREFGVGPIEESRPLHLNDRRAPPDARIAETGNEERAGDACDRASVALADHPRGRGGEGLPARCDFVENAGAPAREAFEAPQLPAIDMIGVRQLQCLTIDPEALLRPEFPQKRALNMALRLKIVPARGIEGPWRK